MVFKGRFFSSKKADSSSTDGSNSPRTPTLDSPNRSDKKKLKSPKEDPQHTSSFCRQTLVKDGGSGKSTFRQKKKEGKGKVAQPQGQTQAQTRSPPAFASHSASSSSNYSSKSRNAVEIKDGAPAAQPTLSPVAASSLGLNRIKTRSGPLPQESFFGFRGENKGSALGVSNLSRAVADGCSTSSYSGKSTNSGKKKDGQSLSKKISQDKVSSWIDNGSNSNNTVTGGGLSRDQSPIVQSGSGLLNGISSQLGESNVWSLSHDVRNPDVRTPEPQAPQTPYDGLETPKESESPRFQAIMRVTSAPRKRFPGDIKSFSHELNSKGVKPFPFWKPRSLNNLEEVLVAIRAKFDKAKEEVDSDLAIFAGDVVGILEKNAETGTHPEWQETLEDLLVLARRCAVMSPGEFWLQCEGIVQDLDDRRQEVPMGVLKQLHTRMLFILTRCTRLLQFHKESGLAEDEPLFGLRQSRILQSAEKVVPPGLSWDDKSFSTNRSSKVGSVKKAYSQEQHGLNWKKDQADQPGSLGSPVDAESTKKIHSPGSRERIASWKKLPSPAERNRKDAVSPKDEDFYGRDGSQDQREGSDTIRPTEALPAKDLPGHSSIQSKHQHKVSWGYWGDQQNVFDESSIICRICEEEVPTSHVEDHSRICAIADRSDQKGLSVNERLLRVAETLEKMAECCSQKDQNAALGSPDVGKISNSSVTEESDGLSPKLSDWSRRGSEDMLDCLPETDGSAFADDFKNLPTMSCRTRFGPKSDQGMATSSAGSMTPRSPLLTPRTSQIDLLLAGRGAFSEYEDLPLINDLADIARSVANIPMDDDRSSPYLVSCLEELQVVINRRKLDALTVETFGARIEKLLREKYLQLCELVFDEKVDVTSTVIDEDGPLEDDVVRSLRTSPIHSNRDRTSIDDFEIIKPISRGAFGRVFLAKKRTTGDLFAIKVLKKADMIRKNAVESILAERDILISVRNPFVVRFFYSFTCQENLYLVMEYFNGGDLYSLLRNLGCLDEEVARIYIAEVVLALEYLHSLRVVHRDLKPDNLLIAHDGHIKLTDFGLSKVGLINSTDDLSGPAASGTSLLGEEDPQPSASNHLHQRERRQKRSAVGTPDYLAPEILLGTGHGTTADWWSVGVILFELIVGIPPFNAEHPQQIFDNILNRKIPWPQVPEEMSPEAYDLIDKLLTEDPSQRLGANGASEVKQHLFFKDISWDTLARQKAAFVPASDSALDTSYFTSRYSWNPSDEHVYAVSEYEDTSDADSLSGSSSCVSNRQDEVGDECGGLAEFDSSSPVKYSFSNFSFKNLSQLASINYDLLSKGWKDEPPSNPDH
ncbi:probable serine/threonine protein kinase IREH1 [Aristolochia californica]|uniref:probable serine/threonine protein kinase IREH1 n=1 Tax=Aristolochia californica TaxID=171875 RepID=UPI0035E3A7F0